MKITGIYCLTNRITGKLYVGQSLDIHARWNQHSKGKEPFAIGRSIAKHGWAAFSAEILEECAAADLNARESHWVDRLGSLSPKGYNLTTGGGQGKQVSDDVRARISERTKAGLTPEVLERRNAAMRGIPKSAEWRAAMSERMRQRYKDPAEVEKLRVRALAMTAETKAKISAGRRGIKVTEETKRLMSEIAKADGRAKRMREHPNSRSAETRAKMAAAAAARAAPRDPATGRYLP